MLNLLTTLVSKLN